MSESKNQSRRSGLSGEESAVLKLSAEAEQRQRETDSDGRGKPGHAGRVGVSNDRGRKRAKATFDLSVARQSLIEEMADQEGVTKSDIVEAATVIFYNAWNAGSIPLDNLKEPTRSLKALWKLAIPDDLHINK